MPRRDAETSPQRTYDARLITNQLIGAGHVVFLRAVAHAVGSHSAGLLLSQFWSWTTTMPKERDGWFWKTQQEIYAECVMTRREQETAGRRLVELGLIEEDRRGIPAKLWFRVDVDAVLALLELAALSGST